MTTDTLLQIFLLVDVFIAGMVAVVALRHALAHFRPEHHDAEVHHPRPQAQNGHLPPAVRQRLIEASEHQFETVLDRSASQLQHDLHAITLRLNKQLETLASEIVSSETRQYREELDKLKQQAETALSRVHSDIAGHQTEIQAKLAEEEVSLREKLAADIAAERQRLAAQMDSRLADAVAAFLLETLGHNVDLGAQSSYLTAMLEEHKAELTRKVTNA